MKRINYACESMIEEVKELRKQGITDFFCTTIVNRNGKDHWYKPVMKHTAQGISKYANDQFIKYGETTTVEVEYIVYTDTGIEFKGLTTYHA